MSINAMYQGEPDSGTKASGDPRRPDDFDPIDDDEALDPPRMSDLAYKTLLVATIYGDKALVREILLANGVERPRRQWWSWLWRLW